MTLYLSFLAYLYDRLYAGRTLLLEEEARTVAGLREKALHSAIWYNGNQLE
jgi:hypothetical protein